MEKKEMQAEAKREEERILKAEAEKRMRIKEEDGEHSMELSENEK
jgi:hypothetical protein